MHIQNCIMMNWISMCVLLYLKSKNNYISLQKIITKNKFCTQVNSCHLNVSRINDKLELSFNDAWIIVDGTKNQCQRYYCWLLQKKSFWWWQLQACDAKFPYFLSMQLKINMEKDGSKNYVRESPPSSFSSMHNSIDIVKL